MIMKIANLATCIATALLLTAPLTKADDWPQWRGPNRNGTSSEKITWPASGPKQLWKAVVGTGYSGVSISKGRAYTMGLADGLDTVWCLDAKTGAVIWRYAYGGLIRPPELRPPPDVINGAEQHTWPGPLATPCVDGNLVYTINQNGILLALDSEKGKLAWSVDFKKDFDGKKPGDWGYGSSPIVDGDLLLAVVGAKGGQIVAFDKATGKMVWKNGDGGASWNSPVTFALGTQRAVAIISSSKGVSTFNLADGKPLWHFGWNNTAWADALVFGDQILASSAYGKGSLMLKATPDSATEIYRNKNFQSHFPCPVMVGDRVYGMSGYIGHDDKTVSLICFDWNTGAIKWEKPEGGNGLIAAGNILLIQAADGDLIAAEASSDAYKEIAKVPAVRGWKAIGKKLIAQDGSCWTTPSLANGCVYCRDGEGNVVCLDLGEEKP